MRTATINRTLAELASDHHGLIHRQLAGGRGVDRQALHARTRNGSLEQLAPNVFRLAGAPPTWEQRALATVWEAGPHALLSHRAAGHLWGLDGVGSVAPEVITLRGKRPARSPHRIHETRALTGADLARRRGIPCTSVVRTLLDMTGVLHPFRAEQALEDALRRRLCTVDQVAERFAQLARRGRKGTKVMRELLADRTGAYVPTMSEFERRTCALLERSGLPRPERQHPVEIGHTTVYLDLAWPGPKVAVECDGMFHHAHNQRLPWDVRRQNELVLLGWLVLRFTWRQLVDRPDHLCGQVLAAHRERTGLDLPG